METLLQSVSLIRRAYWLIKLRWVAIAVLVITTFVANNLLGVSLPAVVLYVIAGVLVLYNYLLFDLLNYFTWGSKSPSSETINKVITFQISADLFILTVVLHFSGGVENPFFFYFVFHMIMASILLSSRQSYLEATLAVFLFGLLLLFEYLGIIKHYTLTGFVRHDLHRDGFFVFGSFFIFSTTLYLVVFMTTSICEQLRKQQKGYERVNLILREKDKLKNEYVLRLTHDIRGHLAAIQSCLNLVAGEVVGPLNEKQRDLAERAYHRADKCMAFITALLKLTRMKLTGRLDREVFSLKNVLFSALAAVQNRAARKSIKVDYKIEPAVDEVFGEPILIEETVTNLLFNAIKYTPNKGAVRLNATNRNDAILIEICDSGIGIPEDEIGKIFDEFYRATNARKVEREGTGLGLSIAKQVVERHGGKIWAENNENGGSKFSFTLPKYSGESVSE